MIHPRAFFVTPERHLAILRNIELDGPAFQLAPNSTLGRDANGTWYVDLRNIDKGFRFDPISPKEMARDKDFYIIIEKLVW